MEDSQTDPYQVLHLNPSTVTVAELKNSYRQMALLYHPDKYGGDDQRFKEIKTAYNEILGQLKGKNNTYTYQNLKENYQQFAHQQQKSDKNVADYYLAPNDEKRTRRVRTSKASMDKSSVPPPEPSPKRSVHASVSAPSVESKEPEGTAEQVESEANFDLNKFNQKFVEQQTLQGKAEIPINLTDEDFNQRKEVFYQNKQEIESDLSKTGKMFNTSTAFDRNIFNRQFEHYNGDKDRRSREVAKMEKIDEPLPMTSGGELNKYCSIYDEKTQTADKSEFYVPSAYETLSTPEQMIKNPEKIDQKLSEKFCRQRDITTQEPIDASYHQIISQKIKEYKERNIHQLTQKGKNLLDH
jgi:hypothetical protein